MDMVDVVTSSVMCNVEVLFNSTLNPLTVVVAKFVAEAETLYVPTGKLVNRYSPWPFATVSCWVPVPVLVATTLAFGTAAPLLSKIVPTKSPLIIWDRTGPAKIKPNAITAKQSHEAMLW